MEKQLDESNKKLLTRASDRISFLYIERARIEQTDYSIQIRQGNKVSEIPITLFSCLLLGPGVSITHRAVENIAKASCSICWMGQDNAIFYAYGIPATSKSKNILKQMKYHENNALHSEVIHKMYNYRYPNDKIKSKSLEELRGFEGKKVKECYQRLAEEYEIDWKGRTYNLEDFESYDLTNRYLSALNSIFYAITMSILNIMGYSPAIGFIHTGHINSFTFDITDLFKEETTIPLAFKLSKELGYFDKDKMLVAFREVITEKHILSNMVNFLEKLFDEEAIDSEVELKLWGAEDFGNFHKNFG